MAGSWKWSRRVRRFCHDRAGAGSPLGRKQGPRHAGITDIAPEEEHVTELTRRDWLALALSGTAALALNPAALVAQQRLLTRAIPSSGERLPVIGLGSSATFSQVARKEDVASLREVLQALVNGGATVFDTAPGYGASEEVAGRIVTETGLADKVFWATKVNVARQGPADPAAARAQIEASFQRVKKGKIDLIQVHNMGDVKTQVPILKELKAQGRIRYLGVTTTFEPQYPQIVETMKSEPLDFIGVDYAIDNREVENTILPLARDRNIGVLVYAPFGRTRLFRRVGDRPVPDWAGEFDAKTWAQFFLKFALSHPAVTVVTPATSQARNMVDNLGGGVGRLPDDAMRKRMVAFVEALPSA
jgi:aryl-alcohol dehydrogenase-like predicted oxidoreductase